VLRTRSEVYRRTDVVGVDIAAEFPLSPHLALDTTTTGPDDVADRIFSLVERTAT
jgi:hypothetical protein